MATTVTIPKGALGADFVKLTPGIEAWLRANNARFVYRYIARSTTIGKIVTPAEIAVHHQAGRAVGLVWEQGSGDFLRGATQGTRDGVDAKKIANQLGMPHGLTITAAADRDVVASNLATSVAYMRAFAAAIAPDYRLGLYGDEDIAKALEGVAEVVCIPGASYWSRRIFQVLRANLPFGQTVHMIQKGVHEASLDKLTVYAPFALWLPTPDLPGPPRPTHDRTLRLGSRGDDVKVWQRLLMVKVDGWFGPQTRRAVKAYQRRNGLTVDGVIGSQTWGAYHKGKH